MWAFLALRACASMPTPPKTGATLIAREWAIELHLVDDLLGQLPGGGEHEGRGAARLGADQVDHRHAEGERLARPRRRLDQHIPAFKDVCDCEPLNCERLCDAALGECAHDWARRAEIGE